LFDEYECERQESIGLYASGKVVKEVPSEFVVILTTDTQADTPTQSHAQAEITLSHTEPHSAEPHSDGKLSSSDGQVDSTPPTTTISIPERVVHAAALESPSNPLPKSGLPRQDKLPNSTAGAPAEHTAERTTDTTPPDDGNVVVLTKLGDMDISVSNEHGVPLITFGEYRKL
jgi:hypothetical protein